MRGALEGRSRFTPNIACVAIQQFTSVVEYSKPVEEYLISGHTGSNTQEGAGYALQYFNFTVKKWACS